MLRNQGGIISLDFLFSMLIASGLMSVLFCVCFTFSIIEVAQYVAFSVARSYTAGHLDVEKQEELGKKRFTSLLNNKVLSPLFKNSWFELKGPDIRGGGDSGKRFEEYPKSISPNIGLEPTGIRLSFTAKLLNLKLALLGTTNPEDANFTTNITGLMTREPTTSECQKQMQLDIRYKSILNLDSSRFSIAKPYSRKYIPMEDNGC